MRAAFLALLTLPLAACQAKQITITDGYVRLPAVAGNPAAAYFTIHGGAKDATLVDVTSSVAIRTEMHESMSQGGAETMAPLKQVAVPAHAKVKFAPGGRHVMLFQLNPTVKAGGAAPLLFTFASGDRYSFNAPVIAAGAPPPK